MKFLKSFHFFQSCEYYIYIFTGTFQRSARKQRTKFSRALGEKHPHLRALNLQMFALNVTLQYKPTKMHFTVHIIKPFQNILPTVRYQLEHDYYHFNTGSVQKAHLAPKSCCSNYCKNIYDTVLILKSLE